VEAILPVVVGERTPVWRWLIPFSRQIRSKATSVGGAESRREDLAVVGQDLIGDAGAPDRGGEHLADGLGGGPAHQAGRHAESAVVVDPGHHLGLGAVREQDPAHHVHLPTLHRALPLPSPELLAPLAPATQLDQPVARQASVDGRSGRDWLHPQPGELVADPTGSPPGVLATQLADLRLDLRRGLVRAPVRTVGAIGEGAQTALLVPGDPGVHALA
jgi:hypothetical protein